VASLTFSATWNFFQERAYIAEDPNHLNGTGGRKMSRRIAFGLGVVVCLAAGAAGAGPASGSSSAPEKVLRRGQYVVERVGMCADCHSPRDAQGLFVAEQALHGAPIGFKPLAPMPWADFALPIAGLPTMSHEQAVHFLMTGEKPDGSHPRPPMPEYRLDRDDAEAVVTYLKSLAPTP